MTQIASCSIKKRVTLLGAVLALFVAGIGAQAIIPRLYRREAKVVLPLSNLLPAALPGWEIRDLPLAETESLQARISTILRYDDALHRTFTKGSITFGIYISYWRPGKVSYYDAGVHTPDTCWVASGWERDSRTHATSLRIGSSRKSKPAEVGVFSKNRVVLYVAFWHLVGAEVITYDQFGWNSGLRGHLERFPNYVRDLWRFGFNQGQEQCFVRISSNRPISELVSDPEVSSILDYLAPLGLFSLNGDSTSDAK